MMQTLKVKLETTLEQSTALLETMHQFNAACNYVAEKAFELHTANKIELQKIVYHEIRDKFGISAQMAVRAISKACEAYKRDKSISLNLIQVELLSMTRESCHGRGLIGYPC